MATEWKACQAWFKSQLPHHSAACWGFHGWWEIDVQTQGIVGCPPPAHGASCSEISHYVYILESTLGAPWSDARCPQTPNALPLHLGYHRCHGVGWSSTGLQTTGPPHPTPPHMCEFSRFGWVDASCLCYTLSQSHTGRRKNNLLHCFKIF